MLYECGKFVVCKAIFSRGKFKSHGYKILKRGKSGFYVVSIVDFPGEYGLRQAIVEVNNKAAISSYLGIV